VEDEHALSRRCFLFLFLSTGFCTNCFGIRAPAANVFLCKWCFGLLGVRGSLDNGGVPLHCYAHWVIGQQASFFFLYSFFFFSPCSPAKGSSASFVCLCTWFRPCLFFSSSFPSLVVGVGVYLLRFWPPPLLLWPSLSCFSWQTISSSASVGDLDSPHSFSLLSWRMEKEAV